jgi:hypothetical protein
VAQQTRLRRERRRRCRRVGAGAVTRRWRRRVGGRLGHRGGGRLARSGVTLLVERERRAPRRWLAPHSRRGRADELAAARRPPLPIEGVGAMLVVVVGLAGRALLRSSAGRRHAWGCALVRTQQAQDARLRRQLGKGRGEGCRAEAVHPRVVVQRSKRSLAKPNATQGGAKRGIR